MKRRSEGNWKLRRTVKRNNGFNGNRWVLETFVDRLKLHHRARFSKMSHRLNLLFGCCAKKTKEKPSRREEQKISTNDAEKWAITCENSCSEWGKFMSKWLKSRGIFWRNKFTVHVALSGGAQRAIQSAMCAQVNGKQQKYLHRKRERSDTRIAFKIA